MVQWVARCDGSFKKKGMVVGATIAKGEGDPILWVVLKVNTGDANRAEALGLQILALVFTSALTKSSTTSVRDTSHIILLVHRSNQPKDIFFFNCCKMSRDCMMG